MECLKTKLKTSIEDSSMRRVDEIALRLKTTTATRYIQIDNAEGKTVRIIGSGEVMQDFTTTFSVPCELHPTNGVFKLTFMKGFDGIVFLPKYQVVLSSIGGEVNVEDLNFLNNTSLEVSTNYNNIAKDSGDLLCPYGNLDNLNKKYTFINIIDVETDRKLLANIRATDVSQLIDPEAEYVTFLIAGNSIGLDLANLPKHPLYASTLLRGNKIKGDLSSYKDITLIGGGTWSRTLNITGSINDLNVIPHPTTGRCSIAFKSIPNITGNIAKLNKYFYWMSAQATFVDSEDIMTELPDSKHYASFTWDSEGEPLEDKFFIAMELVPFASTEDVDRMFLDQVKRNFSLVKAGEENAGSLSRTICIYGRPSNNPAVQEAMEQLRNMGDGEKGISIACYDFIK